MRELRVNPGLLHALNEQRFPPSETRALICQGRVIRLWFLRVNFLTVLRCLPLKYAMWSACRFSVSVRALSGNCRKEIFAD